MSEEEVLRMYEQVRSPTPPFTIIGTYTAPYNGSEFRFSSLASADRVLAYSRDDENGRIIPQYRDNQHSVPVTIIDASDIDILRMLATIVASKTKKSQPLEKIIFRYEPLFNQMVLDLNAYKTRMH